MVNVTSKRVPRTPAISRHPPMLVPINDVQKSEHHIGDLAADRGEPA